jgi:hypothetical protein
MKKILVFLFSTIFFISCVDFADYNPVPVKDFTLKLNANVANDSVYYLIDELILAEVFDANGNKVVAEFDFGNGNAKVSAIQTADRYPKEGVYKLTAKVNDKVLSVTIIVKKDLVIKLKINNEIVTNGSNLKITEGSPLALKVIDEAGNALVADWDFGNGTKVTASNTSVTYVVGLYRLSAHVSGKMVGINVEVSKTGYAEAVVIISSTFSGEADISKATINVVFGLRCNAIPSLSLTKDTYVAGEMPNVNWKDYKLSETTTVNGVTYFKWNVTLPVLTVKSGAKFRFSWLQMKDGGTDLYKNGAWAYDLNSKFFNSTEGLFITWLRIKNLETNTLELTSN